MNFTKWKWLQTISHEPKIWLLSVRFEKFACINQIKTIHSLMFFPDCRWFLFWFIDLNFSKLTYTNQICRNVIVYIHYNICKISTQITECKIFAPQDLLLELPINFLLVLLNIALLHIYQYGEPITLEAIAFLFIDSVFSALVNCYLPDGHLLFTISLE